jgi:hypothetical protein
MYPLVEFYLLYIIILTIAIKIDVKCCNNPYRSKYNLKRGQLTDA